MDSEESTKTYYGFVMVKKLNGTICGRYPLTKKECKFGRDDKCDIKILLENVSGHHCSIYYIDDKAYIRDKSLSGSTKVNGKNIGRNNFLLHHSDEIEISNRKFVWEYASSYAKFNNSSNKKPGIKVDHCCPRLPERSLNQINTPQDNTRLSLTPAKSAVKSSSKTLLSLNKTPIIVASENMSKHSFDELKSNLQKQNSSMKTQSEHKLSKSYSMVPGRNIPLLGDFKSTPRKSWVVSNTSDNLSSSGGHFLKKLSTERVKRDITPEYNSSYHYQDENVEFDSPEPTSPLAISNNDCPDFHCINNLTDNNLSVGQSESIVHQSDHESQTSPKTNVLPNSETEPNSSRRDTYSIDTGSIIFEQNSTPTPRRSILKCSKTAKPNRSRSSCRMVQFARLPKTDSKVKMSKSRFNTVPNFVVTSEMNEADASLDSSKVTQCYEEQYDDDLDGVQPLDISVSSLINSPILDISSVHKSSKRGSRGNKVMSLISSFENRTHDSPKQSIRASDLLSVSGSISGGSTLHNDSQKHSNELQDSVSSSRRINLEDVFVAEDSLKNASRNLENKTMVDDLDESSKQHVEMTSDSEINVLNSTNSSKKVSDEGSVVSNDVSQSEDELNFVSPLKIQPEINSSKTSLNDLNQYETNISQPIISHNIEENCIQVVDNSSIVSNVNIENVSLLTLYKTSDHDNVDVIQNNVSKNIDPTNEVSITIKNINNVSALPEKNNLKDLNQEQSNVSKLSKNSSFENDRTNVQNCSADVTENLINEEKDRSDSLSYVSKLVEKSSDVEKDDLIAQKDVSNPIDEEESPSMIIQCMSKTLNSSVDELETTHSQLKDNSNESYLIVDKSNLENLSSETPSVLTDNLNKSLMDAIEVQLDKMHDSSVSVNENELVSVNSSPDTSIEKTLISSVVSEKTETENLNLEVNDNSSKNSKKVTLDESSTSIFNSATKTKLSVENNSNIQNSDVSQLIDNESDKDLNSLENSNLGSKSTTVTNKSIDLSKTVPSDNCLMNEKDKSKSINSSYQETSNIFNSTCNSKNLNKSKLSKKDLSTCVIENTKTRSSRKIVNEVPLHSDINHIEDSRKINKSFEDPLDTSIGKPRYESTPWNGSKSSKTLNSTASNQVNETSHGDASIIVDEQNKTTQSNSSTSIQPDELTDDNITENDGEEKNRNRSTTPDIKPEVWSQMMKDFNESVKKASGTNYVHVIDKCYKIPIGEELKSKHNSIREEESPTNTDSKNVSQLAENKSILQCSRVSSCASNNSLKISIEHDNPRKSTRNSTRLKSQSEIPKRSLRVKSSQSKHTKPEVNTNSEKIVSSEQISNKKDFIDTETTTIKKRSGSTILNNLNSDISNEDSPVAENPLPLFKSVTNSAKKNKKTISTKPDIVISTPESKHNSNIDSSPNESIRITRNKKMTKRKHSSPELPPTRRNIRGKIEKNDSIISNKKLDKVVITVNGATSSGNDTEMSFSGSGNELPAAKRQLRRREQNVCIEQLKPILKDQKKLTSSNKPQKNTSNSEKNSDKILTVEKSKEIQPINTRFTRSNSTLNEASLPKSIKKTKKSTPIKTKSVKVVKIKKTTSKSNKKSQSKSLPSKPINKKNKSDSSEYESLSETEEIPPKTQLIDNQPKRKKENIKKKNVQTSDDSSSLTTRRKQREVMDTLNVSSQLSTRSRKRAADSSPLCQPNAKGLKRDISSKVANTRNSRVSNSPKECASSDIIKHTRNMSKLVISQSSNNSFPETVKNGKKEKCTTKSILKKRVLNSDESSVDSAPSARKITRKATTKENETEIKKSTRSKSKVQSTDTDDSKNSAKGSKNFESPKPIKKRTTKQADPKSTKSPPPRVLRSKRK